jgi:hypothetical protein
MASTMTIPNGSSHWMGKTRALVALGRDHDPPPGRPGRLNGQVRPLLGADPAQEQHEVVLVGLERVLGGRDGVVHRGRPRQVGAVGPLRLGDGDQRVVAAEQPVALAELALDRPVGGEHGRGPAGPGDQGAAHGVVVDHIHVQPVQVLVDLEGVEDLGERGAEAAPRWVLEGLQEPLGAGPAVAGADQRDLVAAGHQALDQPADHGLDTAIAVGRDREPGRRDDSDAQVF